MLLFIETIKYYLPFIKIVNVICLIISFLLLLHISWRYFKFRTEGTYIPFGGDPTNIPFSLTGLEKTLGFINIILGGVTSILLYLVK